MEGWALIGHDPRWAVESGPRDDGNTFGQVSGGVGSPSGNRSNYVPLYKWDLTFSGSGVLNANQFLKRVEELAETRRVRSSELFAGILELLSGEALIWFRVHKNHIRSWEEFKRELKLEFLPISYEDALWREIRSRNQGQGERISSYIAC